VAIGLIFELMAMQTVAIDQKSRMTPWSPKEVCKSLGSNDAVKVTVKMTVPAAAGGLILGRGGMSIKAMNEQSGARIQMTGKEGAIFTQERVITLVGALAESKKAAEMIISKLAEDDEVSQYQNRGTSYSASIFGSYPMGGRGGGRGIVGGRFMNQMGGRGGRGGGRGGGYPNGPIGFMFPSNTTITLEVPDSAIGNILGKQGSTLREMMGLSGAKIMISPRGDYPNSDNNRVVTITGTPQAAQTAHYFCTQKLAQGTTSRLRKQGKAIDAPPPPQNVNA